MKITIMSAENGWILQEHLEEGEVRSGFSVFGHDETDEGQAKTFADLLWKLKEIMGPSESRYSAHRVMIRIEPGDKHEGGL